MTHYQTDTQLAGDEVPLRRYHWPVDEPRAVCILVHGMAEHAARYDAFAHRLQQQGIASLALDLRGHGATAPDKAALGCFGKGGWQRVREDIVELTQHARDLYLDAPLMLFGHSMGSVIARAVLMHEPERYEGLVLSGVTVDKPGRRQLGPILAGTIAFLTGDKPSPLIDKLTFGDFNKAFLPARTPFDWLSADETEVDAYVADPFCGFVSHASLYREVARMLLDTLKRENVARIPAGLPILCLSGAMDPVGLDGKAAAYLQKTWSDAGLDICTVVVPEGRHELLHDRFRDEVTQRVLSFVEGLIGEGGCP